MALDGIGPVITDITTAGLVPTLLAVATFAIGFLAGVFDSVLGSDEEDPEPDEEPTQSDGGTMFDDEGETEAEFEAGGDDPFGGDAFAAAEPDDTASDLEPRIEQLEEEVSGLSSTVSTVRTENEQISDSVTEVEENVRKLLDIYKMVTKGVNPFVDQQSGGVAASVDEETLGLFEDDDTSEETDSLDDEVMETEAEEFFDDSFETDSDADDGAQSSADGSEPLDTDDDTRSFDDLKSEYDADETHTNAPTETPAASTEAATTDQSTPSSPDDAMATNEAASTPRTATDSDSQEPANTTTTDPDSSPPQSVATQPPSTEEPQSPAAGDASSTPATGRPYLRVLPPGVASDQLVLEWIEFLIDASNPNAAYTAITHYQRLEWLGEDAATHLKRFIAGHPQATTPLQGTGQLSELSVDHHVQSLKYIAQLSSSRTDLWLWGNELSQLDPYR